VVLELDDLVIQMKVAHGQITEDGYYVGLERIGEVEEKAALERVQSGLRQSTLVRNIAIVAALVCGVMAYLFLPTVFDQLQGKKKRTGSAPSAISLPQLIR
jgi:hypothetical protein